MIGKITSVIQMGTQYLVQIMSSSCEFDSDIEVEVKKKANGKSLSQNGYFHKLVELIANQLTITGTPISKAQVKNIMLARYGQRMIDINGDPLVFMAPEGTDLSDDEDFHTALIGHEDGKDIYSVIRGTRTYDSREMNILISGTILEAKQIGGIETLTPRELARLKTNEEHTSGQ